MTNFLKNSNLIVSYRVGLGCLAAVFPLIIVPRFLHLPPMTEVIVQVYLPFMLLFCHLGIFKNIRCPSCRHRLGYKLLKNVLLFKSNTFAACPMCRSTCDHARQEKVFFSMGDQN